MASGLIGTYYMVWKIGFKLMVDQFIDKERKG
jgi:hypothetical protein